MAVKRDFSFRGKTLEQLQAMTDSQFAELLTSRARRSLLRGFDKSVEKRIKAAIQLRAQNKLQKPIRTHKRVVVVVPRMVGLSFAVHKGNSFEQIEIIPQMLGHFLGELVMTRKRLSHGKAGIGATKSSTAITAR